MNRAQAVALVKELVASELIEPSWISIQNVTNDLCKLKINIPVRKQEIRAFILKNDLLLEEQEEYWLLSKN